MVHLLLSTSDPGSLTQAFPREDIDLLVRALFGHDLDEVLVRELLRRGPSLPARDEVPVKVNVVLGNEGDGRGTVERSTGGRRRGGGGALLGRGLTLWCGGSGGRCSGWAEGVCTCMQANAASSQ